MVIVLTAITPAKSKENRCLKEGFFGDLGDTIQGSVRSALLRADAEPNTLSNASDYIELCISGTWWAVL